MRKDAATKYGNANQNAERNWTQVSRRAIEVTEAERYGGYYWISIHLMEIYMFFLDPRERGRTDKQSYFILRFSYFVWFVSEMQRNRKCAMTLNWNKPTDIHIHQNGLAWVFANWTKSLFSCHIFTFSMICLLLIPLFCASSVWYLFSWACCSTAPIGGDSGFVWIGFVKYFHYYWEMCGEFSAAHAFLLMKPLNVCE